MFMAEFAQLETHDGNSTINSTLLTSCRCAPTVLNSLLDVDVDVRRRSRVASAKL